MGFRAWGFGFRESGFVFRFRVSVFGIRVSVLSFRVEDCTRAFIARGALSTEAASHAVLDFTCQVAPAASANI